MERNTDKNGEKQNLRHAFMIFVLFNLIYINAFYMKYLNIYEKM